MRSLTFAALAVAARAQWPQLCGNNTGSSWNQTACPVSATCAPNGFSVNKWGCCPFEDAVICSDYQCCPSGTTCQIMSGNGSNPSSYENVYSCVEGSTQVAISKCSCKPGPSVPPSTTLKNVLIIGDSVSIGYTPVVAQQLADVALVQHGPWDVSDGGAEESAYAEQCLDYWLHSPSGIPYYPDVIYFNSGMHNLVVNGTNGEGTVPGQSGNSTEYAAQMANVTARLQAFATATGARLIFGITSPMLCNTAADEVITGTLNPAATAIMAGAGIPTVDLHAAIVAKCGPVPQASCFGETGCWCPHCPPGYAWLAESTVAPAIRAELQAMAHRAPLQATLGRATPL